MALVSGTTHVLRWLEDKPIGLAFIAHDIPLLEGDGPERYKVSAACVKLRQAGVLHFTGQKRSLSYIYQFVERREVPVASGQTKGNYHRTETGLRNRADHKACTIISEEKAGATLSERLIWLSDAIVEITALMENMRGDSRTSALASGNPDTSEGTSRRNNRRGTNKTFILRWSTILSELLTLALKAEDMAGDAKKVKSSLDDFSARELRTELIRRREAKYVKAWETWGGAHQERKARETIGVTK